jgi:hypothetical protein
MQKMNNLNEEFSQPNGQWSAGAWTMSRIRAQAHNTKKGQSE